MLDLSHPEEVRRAIADVQAAATFYRRLVRDGLGAEDMNREPDLRDQEMAGAVDHIAGMAIRAWLAQRWGVDRYYRAMCSMAIDGDSTMHD